MPHMGRGASPSKRASVPVPHTGCAVPIPQMGERTMTVEDEKTTEEETETTEPKEALETEEVAEEAAEEEAEEETEEEEEKMVSLAALQESRAKERELKRQNKEFKRIAEEAKAREAEAKQTDAESEDIDWEELIGNPEAYARKIRELNRSENRQDVVVLSEAFAMETFPDYEETLEKSGFLAELKTNNALAQTIANQPSPALAAYRYAKGMLDEAESGNTEEQIEKARIEGGQEVIDNVTSQKKKGISPKRGGAEPVKLTTSKAADLSPDDWAKLSQEEKDRLKGKPQ